MKQGLAFLLIVWCIIEAITALNLPAFVARSDRQRCKNMERVYGPLLCDHLKG